METKTHKISVFLFVSLLVITLISGGYMLLRIRSLEKSIPVTSISQYRHLASALTLVINLTTDIELTIVDYTPERIEQTRFQVNKTILFIDQIKVSFNNQIPEDLFSLLNELELLLPSFKQLTDSEFEFDRIRTILMHNRLEYLITEFQDYVIRINDRAIINLEKQVGNVEMLQRSMIIALLLIFVSAAVMTYFIFLQKKMISTIESAVEEASQANRAKGDFLANMSHEIRTPMNAIIGFTELLYGEEEEPEKKDKLRMIKTSGRNLLLLINDILDFSKIEAGKIDMENKSFNLRTTLDHLYSMYKSKADEKGLDYNINIDKSVPEFVGGDEHKIIQILTNIIGNALKFTKEGSLAIDCNYYDGRSVIKVVDTGIGIPGDKLDHVFSTFTQADSSTERKYGGTGLGLAISRSLAELLGGSLTVVSTEGVGSTFIFELPLQEVKEGERYSQTAATVDSKPEAGEGDEGTDARITPRYRILVAEDNNINQKLIKALLKEIGIECDIAENGRIALDMLNGKPYDLLLLDMQMPVMDGLETIRHIRSDKDLKNLHVIALTANAMEGDAEKYIEAGCNDYISKPIDRELFQEKLLEIEDKD